MFASAMPFVCPHVQLTDHICKLSKLQQVFEAWYVLTRRCFYEVVVLPTLCMFSRMGCVEASRVTVYVAATRVVFASCDMFCAA